MIWITYTACLVICAISLWLSFRVFKINNTLYDDKVSYGESHSLHPETRSFEVFEEVYYKGEVWIVDFWSRHY